MRALRAPLVLFVVAAVAAACAADDELTRDAPFAATDEDGADPGSAPAPPAAFDASAQASGGDAAAPEGGDAAATPSGGTCVEGYEYCGGNKVIGDASTVYKCNGPGAPTVVATCARGCIVNPSIANDACVPERVASPVPGRSVTYAYGERNDRYRLGYHTGDDYATPSGSHAVAVRSGRIRWSNDAGGDFGFWIGLDADNGRTYVYAHLSRRFAQVGDRVLAGQVIGLTGNTGLSTGPHLHFEDRPLGATTNDVTRKPSW